MFFARLESPCYGFGIDFKLSYKKRNISPLDPMKCGNLHIVLLLAVFTVPADGWAASVTIGASKDNSIFRNAPNNSAGGSAGIFAGTTAFGAPRRGLIAFDVAGSVPAGATITSAELTLYLGVAGGAVGKNIGLHRLDKDWGEGTAGSALPTVRSAGNGFSASPGDATWNANYFGMSVWSSPGAASDFYALASSSTVVDDAVDMPFTWASTPALVRDVQNWLDSPATNFGWAIVNADEVNIATARAFYSREATMDASGDPLDLSHRPALTISFVPEPTSAIFIMSLIITAAFLRRRSP
jgi:hypothetical protein